MTTQIKLSDIGRQAGLLIAIARYWNEHGFSPSYEDLSIMVSITSTSLVSYHLGHLEKWGLITREPNITRSIVLTEAGKTLASELAYT